MATARPFVYFLFSVKQACCLTRSLQLSFFVLCSKYDEAAQLSWLYFTQQVRSPTDLLHHAPTFAPSFDPTYDPTYNPTYDPASSSSSAAAQVS